MKKTFLGITMLVFLSFTMISCGDTTTDDPQPVKTDLELVKEGILGKWNFVSAKITKGGEFTTYTGGCDFTAKPSWVQANAHDSDYTFTTSSNVSKHRNCSNEDFDFTYTITEKDGKFTIEISDGIIFEILSPTNEINSNTVMVSTSPLLQGVSSNILTFSK